VPPHVVGECVANVCGALLEERMRAVHELEALAVDTVAPLHNREVQAAGGERPDDGTAPGTVGASKRTGLTRRQTVFAGSFGVAALLALGVGVRAWSSNARPIQGAAAPATPADDRIVQLHTVPDAGALAPPPTITRKPPVPPRATALPSRTVAPAKTCTLSYIDPATGITKHRPGSGAECP
jgi:hypothetical protein